MWRRIQSQGQPKAGHQQVGPATIMTRLNANQGYIEQEGGGLFWPPNSYAPNLELDRRLSRVRCAGDQGTHRQLRIESSIRLSQQTPLYASRKGTSSGRAGVGRVKRHRPLLDETASQPCSPNAGEDTQGGVNLRWRSGSSTEICRPPRRPFTSSDLTLASPKHGRLASCSDALASCSHGRAKKKSF